ncbi:trehalose-phosphatase [Hyphomicrobium sp. MC8b]|jgi:trehalose 6-phosphate phosphatase|uniref:trehalose-phosphatase n=1 Tax=Hyphomicrobium sp. MC8b TaxID=300273 RepID=UPI00391B36F3
MQHLRVEQTDTGISPRERAAALRANVEKLVSSEEPVAIFLDIDGTLLDVALTPSTVHVPAILPDLISSLSQRLAGAVAIITGRPLMEADRLLSPSKFIGAGVHGGQMRLADDGEIETLTPSFDPELQAAIKKIVHELPGVVFEDKGSGIALHYRLVPDMQQPLTDLLEALLPLYPNQFKICGGRKVVEILPVGFSKGRALRRIASLPQFANKTPVMLGDDISDIDAFQAAEDLSGFGLKVAGENFSKDEASFQGPADVLNWLQMLAGTGR